MGCVDLQKKSIEQELLQNRNRKIYQLRDSENKVLSRASSASSCSDK